ncbi:MAG: hypothetical protein A4E55_02197 [Pelotomaculum sp. PtaU1.Bin035]|nr:MAG: hypothetical protein A4E55_02197 [Pelotomaculum sp. PtaU1.Bin035]
MKRFLDALDCRSRAVWWHLCCHGHAGVTGLARVAGLDSDMEVLLSIRQVINPAAIDILGEPAVEFASCRVDQGTGEKIHYHWWLRPVVWSPPPGRLPLVDVFETGSELVIIVDPGDRVESSHPEVTCRNGIVMIKIDRSGNRQ